MFVKRVIRYVVEWSVFFFKQKTAYEMRISDRSSDVCSSDLLAGGGVKHILTVDVADSCSTDGAVERNAGNSQRSRSADHGGDIGVDFGVNRNSVQNDLDFVVEAFGKQGAQRAGGKARHPDFFFGRTAFTTENTQGKKAGRVAR